MGWDGAGNFTRARNWQNDEAADIDMLSANFDEEDDNFATGINACLTKNGETKSTADFRPNATRSYALGSTALRWTTAYLGTGVNVQSATAAAATTIAFTDGTSARTITIPDASGTISLLGSDESFSGVKTMSGKSLWMAEGGDVASANDCNIWTTDGNTVHITGATEIQDWGTAPQAGAWKWVIFDSTPQLTYHATTNKLNTNAANYTAVAGDRALVYAESTSAYIVTIFPVNVNPYTLSGASVALAATGTDNASVASTAFVQQEIEASGGIASVGVGTLKFGTINISQNATQYLSALGTTTHGTESIAEYYVNDHIRLSTLYVSASALAPAGQTCVVTVRKNAADTAITATITDAVQDTSDLVNTVDLVPGDRLSVKAVTSATFGSTNDIKVSLVAKIAGTNTGAGLLLLNSVGATTPNASGEAQASTTSMVTGLHLPVPTCSIGHDYAQTGTVSINKNATTYAVGSSSPFTGVMDLVCAAGDYIYFPTAGADASGAISFRPTRMRHLAVPGLIAFASWNQTQNTTVYAGGWTVSTSSATEADVSLPISAGTIKNLRVALDSAPAAGNTCIVTVRKNGVDTALTVTIGDTETIDADTSNTVSFSAGDKLSISVALSATSGSRYVGITVEHVTA